MEHIIVFDFPYEAQTAMFLFISKHYKHIRRVNYFSIDVGHRESFKVWYVIKD